MGDGTSKQIRDVQVGDEVITFDPETQKQSIVKVSHTYKNKTEKQMFTITTVSGREITATYDHRFMTSEGWKRLDELKTIRNSEKNSLIGISLEPQSVTNFTEDGAVITLSSNQSLKEFGRLLSLPVESKKLPLISRLIGFLIRKKISINDEGEYNVVVQFKHEKDIEDFDNDVRTLGLPVKKFKFLDMKFLYYGQFPQFINTLLEDFS